MRLVRLAILSRQRIGKIGIEQDMDPLPLQQESALPQPPQAKLSIPAVRGADVGEQHRVRLHRLNHARPSSLRTIETPRTRLISFCRAAQRAVWLRPQSGAKESCSGAAYLRQSRTRSATSAGVST